MNTAINIEFDLEVELRMSSKTEYHDTFDKKFDIVFDTIDVQRFSLFEIINKIKMLPFSVDADLVRIIIQKKLDHIVGHPTCPKCGAPLSLLQNFFFSR